MKIYIVTGVDQEPVHLEEQHVCVMKAFDSQEKAHEFMADCGFQLEQWQKAIPTEVEDDDVNAANWHKHCEAHPVASKYGVYATTFFCQEMEVE